MVWNLRPTWFDLQTNIVGHKENYFKRKMKNHKDTTTQRRSYFNKIFSLCVFVSLWFYGFFSSF